MRNPLQPIIDRIGEFRRDPFGYAAWDKAVDEQNALIDKLSDEVLDLKAANKRLVLEAAAKDDDLARLEANLDHVQRCYEKAEAARQAAEKERDELRAAADAYVADASQRCEASCKMAEKERDAAQGEAKRNHGLLVDLTRANNDLMARLIKAKEALG